MRHPNFLGENKLAYFEELTAKRLAQRTNVYFMETDQLRSIVGGFKKYVAGSNLAKAFGREYEEIINYNLQRNWNQLTHVVPVGKDKKGWQPIQMEMGSNPLQILDDYLTNKKTIVIIDYVVFPQHADALSDMLIAWSHDVKLYDNKSTVILFTSNINLFNETLRNLCYPIIIESPTTTEREARMSQLTKDLNSMGKQSGQTINLKVTPELIQQSAGLGLDQIETALIESFRTSLKSGKPEFKLEYITRAKIERLKAANMFYSEPKIPFSSVGGYEGFKEEIRNDFIKLIQHPEKAVYYGLKIPKGLLLYGPPGTGKTLISEAIAYELGLAMIKWNPADERSKFVGESESNLRQSFTLFESLSGENAPVIIVIDEFDSAAPARGKVMMTDSGVGRTLTNKLLEYMGDKNRKSVVIGMSNFLEDIDEAMLRPGRMNNIYLMLYPDLPARVDILRLHTTVFRKMPLEANFDYKAIASKTLGWSGADLEKLCEGAARLALKEDAKEVIMQYFTESMNSFEINAKDRLQKMHNYVAEAKKHENVNITSIERQLREFMANEGKPEDSRLQGLFDNTAVSV